jgi:hypothetical protein
VLKLVTANLESVCRKEVGSVAGPMLYSLFFVFLVDSSILCSLTTRNKKQRRESGFARCSHIWSLTQAEMSLINRLDIKSNFSVLTYIYFVIINMCIFKLNVRKTPSYVFEGIVMHQIR